MQFYFEPMTRIELVTSSLPRKRSTPELHRRSNEKNVSGRRDSNSRRSAWKADALPTELLPLIFLLVSVGRAGFEPAKVYTSRFTVCPRWPLEYLPNIRADGGIRTPDQLITNQLLWPTELHRLVLFECWLFTNCERT